MVELGALVLLRRAAGWLMMQLLFGSSALARLREGGHTLRLNEILLQLKEAKGVGLQREFMRANSANELQR